MRPFYHYRWQGDILPPINKGTSVCPQARHAMRDGVVGVSWIDCFLFTGGFDGAGVRAGAIETLRVDALRLVLAPSVPGTIDFVPYGGATA